MYTSLTVLSSFEHSLEQILQMIEKNHSLEIVPAVLLYPSADLCEHLDVLLSVCSLDFPKINNLNLLDGYYRIHMYMYLLAVNVPSSLLLSLYIMRKHRI